MNKSGKLFEIMSNDANISRFLALLCVFVIKDVKDVIVSDIIMPNLEVKEDNVVGGFKIHKKHMIKMFLELGIYLLFTLLLIHFFVV